MLIDLVGAYGIDVLAQVDLGHRVHRHQGDTALGVMAAEILETALRRLPHSPELSVEAGLTQFRRDLDGLQVAVRTVPGLERPPAVEIPAYLTRGGAPVTESDRPGDEAGDEAHRPRQRRALVAGASGRVRRPGERRRDAGAGAARSRRPRRPGNGRRERAGCRRGRVRIRPSPVRPARPAVQPGGGDRPGTCRRWCAGCGAATSASCTTTWRSWGRRRWPLSAPSPRRRCTPCTGIRGARLPSIGSSTGGAGSGSTACRTPSWHWRRPSCDSVTRRRPWLATPIPLHAAAGAVERGDHLLVLGRICRFKGQNVAARVAAGPASPLVLAGPVAGASTPAEVDELDGGVEDVAYWRDEIARWSTGTGSGGLVPWAARRRLACCRRRGRC